MTTSPFDIAAATYDKDFTHSRIGQMQRKRVWQILLRLLQSYHRPLHILEINCGTGEDALELAKLGHHVIAMDGSEQMIRAARQKLFDSAPAINIPLFITCDFNSISDYTFNEPFDLVISNFGGLNCAGGEDIIRLSKTLSNIITAEGKLFLVVMSSFCLWEVLYYSLKGRFRKAFRRQQPSVSFKLKQHSLQVYYYAPWGFKKLFYPAFSFLQTQPVGLFIPPSYLEFLFIKRIHWLKRLHRWENKFGFSALSSFADHYCIIFKKRPSHENTINTRVFH